MSDTTEQTADATSPNKRQCTNASNESNASFSNLRNEAKISNDARVNDSVQSKALSISQKKEKRLEPIASLLASLPAPLSQQTKEFASS